MERFAMWTWIRRAVLGGVFLVTSGCMESYEVPEMETDDGKAFVRRCSLCHAVPHPDRLPFDQWEAVVARMARHVRSNNVPPMTDEEITRILRYLKTHARQPAS